MLFQGCFGTVHSNPIATEHACACADANGADDEVHQLSILITAMLGFASYKVAVVAAALTPTTVRVTDDVPANKK